MDRSKIVAIITGAISLLLAIAYLLLVQILDFRGEMVPAPMGSLSAEFSIQSAELGMLPTGEFKILNSFN